jgi:murein L,D-transpeptidase YcbB/YkuD
LIYGSHLLAGRINPETIDSEWHADRRETDLAGVLQRALDADTMNGALEDLLPPQPGYQRLKQALVRFREIDARGGWPMVAPGPKLQNGDRSERVLALRHRLQDSGDISPEGVSDSTVLDEPLAQAVRRFQGRHGLDVDGVVGPATLQALNVSAGDRVREIEVNLERWRWLPQSLGHRYILVNIADFHLDVIEDGRHVMEMRVVVGRGYRRTPVFSGNITYLVLCPYWQVPPNIAVQDKLPLIRKDPEYLSKQHMVVFRGWGGDAQVIDPATIDWSNVSAKNLAYRFRQDPGPWNALGRVKFMFPNKFNVYLHDTPSQELFQKTSRAFSSGCIRLEKPVELAEYLLQDDPMWTRERLLDAVAQWTEQTVQLPQPIPVHLLYWTAWVDSENVVHFRSDLYGRDRRLKEALRENPPDVQ